MTISLIGTIVVKSGDQERGGKIGSLPLKSGELEPLKKCDSYPVGPVNGKKGAFYCIPCIKSVSCTHQGLGDVKEHCTGKTHQKISAAITQSRKITFTKPVHDDRQIRAEVLHTNFIVQCNISFLTTDHLAPLYRVMFPYSNITKNFRCRCIKTACVLNNALHHKTKSDLVECMPENPYVLLHVDQATAVHER